MKYEVEKTNIYDDWFKTVKDPIAKKKILSRIDNIKKGNFGDCESVGEGVSELKIDTGKGYRVYFYMKGLTIVLLTNGGTKQKQQKDIDYAKEIKKHLEGGK